MLMKSTPGMIITIIFWLYITERKIRFLGKAKSTSFGEVKAEGK